MADANPEPWQASQVGSDRRDTGEAATRWWTWPTTVRFLVVAAGFGVWLAFASEEADRTNAGQAVPTGIRVGMYAGALLLLAGVLALLVDAVRRGRAEGRLVARVAVAVAVFVLAILAGLSAMILVVHAAFD
jgi:hypothetical protein